MKSRGPARSTAPGGRTHPHGRRVGALHGGGVEAGEQGTVADRVSLREDQGPRPAAGQLRVQPPDLGSGTIIIIIIM